MYFAHWYFGGNIKKKFFFLVLCFCCVLFSHSVIFSCFTLANDFTVEALHYTNPFFSMHYPQSTWWEMVTKLNKRSEKQDFSCENIRKHCWARNTIFLSTVVVFISLIAYLSGSSDQSKSRCWVIISNVKVLQSESYDGSSYIRL